MRTPSLAAVLHEDFKNPPSGLTGYVIADLVEKNYATLMSELSRQPGHKLGADLVLPLMRKTGSPRAVEFLAREMNGLFIPVPDPAESPTCLVTALAASIREFGEFAAETAESIKDGSIERQELERIEKEGFEAMASIMAMIKLARVTHSKQHGVGL